MKDYQSLMEKILKKSKTVLKHSHIAVYIWAAMLIPFGIFVVAYIFGRTALLLQPKNDPFPLVKAPDYPILAQTFAPAITAQTAYIVDNTSKVVLFAKNDTVRFSPASTTKMMTALVGLDYYKLNDMLTIKRSGVEPVVVGFPYQAKVSFEDLLYAMFLPSGNDAAFAIGDNYPGGEAGFVQAMNAKAKLLHMDNTHYGDPVGLADDEDYTTVHDEAILASFVEDQPLLSKIADTKEKIIIDSLGNTYDLQNINELLGKYGVNGIKTGYTGIAGEVLATSAVVRGHDFIIIVMKSDDRFADTEKLLQLLENNVSFVSVKP